VASFPALLVGAVVQFAGNRNWAFSAASGSLRRQIALFSLAEIVTLGLNALAFDLVARHVALSAGGAVVARAITTNVVFVAWSFPVWRLVFKQPTGARQGSECGERAAAVDGESC
jgi:putative flippase GtrA